MNRAAARSLLGLIIGSSLTLAVGVAWSCTAPRQAEGPPANETPRARIQRLESEARALARSDGCQTAGECRTAPVGDRPCGGPRDYVVYCSRTTDSVALFRKLDDLARAERAYNVQEGLMSTCEFRMPPEVVLSAGACRAAVR